MSFVDEKKVENLLKELQALAAPDRSILRAKNIVMHAVRNGQGSRPIFPKQSFINSLLPQLRFKPMITFSLIVALLLGGGGTVAAAQNDLPGDALYPVKIASEEIVETFALTSNAKIQVEAKLAERRANEVIELQARVDSEARVADEREKEPSPEVKRHIEKATQRLEARIEKTKALVEELKAHDTRGTRNAAAVLQAKVERMEAALKGTTSMEVRVEPKEILKETREQVKEMRKEAIEEKHEDNSSRSNDKSQEDITIELNGEDAVEIELEVPEIEEKKRPFNLLKREEE